MASVQLNQLLPADALAEITQLMREGRCVAENLKHITCRFKEELLSKGVDCDYLAYSIARKVAQLGL